MTCNPLRFVLLKTQNPFWNSFSKLIRRSSSNNILQYTDFKSKIYKLPTRPENSLVLDIINKHELDSKVSINNENEISFDGKIIKSTVEAKLEKYFVQFNADEAIKKMTAGSNWPRKGYTYKDGKPYTPGTIKKKWDDMHTYSKNREAYMRFNITNCLNALEYSSEIIELKKFKSFYENEFEGKGLTPYRSYWNIFDIDCNVVSTVHCICKLPEGDYVLFKFIVSKKIDQNIENNNDEEQSIHENKFTYKMAKPPIQHMEDNELTKEALQMNYNKYILEKYYGLTINDMILVNFHVNLENYQLIKIDNYSEEIEKIINDNNHDISQE